MPSRLFQAVIAGGIALGASALACSATDVTSSTETAGPSQPSQDASAMPPVEGAPKPLTDAGDSAARDADPTNDDGGHATDGAVDASLDAEVEEDGGWHPTK